MNETEFKSLDIIDCSNYNVSEDGTVRHRINQHIKKPSVNQYGTHFVNLTDDFGKQRSIPVATIVAKAFLEPENSNHNTVIFKDGDRTNYHADNLAYRTRSYAIRYNKYFASDSWKKANTRCRLESEDRYGNVKRFDTLLEAAVYHGVLPNDIAISMHHERPVYIVEGLTFYKL